MAEIIRPTAENIENATRLLEEGELIGIPTETVYGLGADATNARAVARVFEAKSRPEFNPLIAHVKDMEAAVPLAVWSDAAQRLAIEFWPGPLTLVLPSAEGSPVAELARAGLDTVALRSPSHPVAQQILNRFDRPIAAPSANRSGQVSPTTAQHVADSLEEAVPLIVDGGDCEIGIESTIVALTGDIPLLLRPGAISADQIEAILGPIERPKANDRVIAPGMLARHYAPATPVQLDISLPSDEAAILGFGPDAPSNSLNLSPNSDLVEAASNLYKMMRELDSGPEQLIQVMPIPRQGIGAAINDRLERAAAPA